MNVLNRIFRKFYSFSMLVLVLSVLGGGGLGYMEIVRSGEDDFSLQPQIDRVGGETRVVESLIHSSSEFGWIDRLKEKTEPPRGAEAAILLDQKGWERGVEYMFGTRYAADIIDGSLKEFRASDPQGGGSVQFPDFSVIGLTFSSDAKKVAASVSYGGHPRIWLFQRSGDSWSCDGFPQGFRIRGLDIRPPLVEIDVVSASDPDQSKVYVIDMSHMDILLDYKIERTAPPAGEIRGGDQTQRGQI